MLMMVVLVRLRESDGGIAFLEKRDVIAAAQVAVAAIDHPDAEVREIAVIDLRDVARELARGAVILSADALPDARFFRRLIGRNALGKDADIRPAGADDIVGEHRIDVPVFFLRLLRGVRRTVESLLFTGD